MIEVRISHFLLSHTHRRRRRRRRRRWLATVDGARVPGGHFDVELRPGRIPDPPTAKRETNPGGRIIFAVARRRGAHRRAAGGGTEDLFGRVARWTRAVVTLAAAIS